MGSPATASTTRWFVHPVQRRPSPRAEPAPAARATRAAAPPDTRPATEPDAVPRACRPAIGPRSRSSRRLVASPARRVERGARVEASLHGVYLRRAAQTAGESRGPSAGCPLFRRHHRAQTTQYRAAAQETRDLRGSVLPAPSAGLSARAARLWGASKRERRGLGARRFRGESGNPANKPPTLPRGVLNRRVRLRHRSHQLDDGAVLLAHILVKWHARF